MERETRSNFEEFRGDGHSTVKAHKDIHDLDLEQIDKVVGFLGAKYKGIALVEGAGAGAVGIAGLAVDIPALITLNLRAIGEYAAYYGFDTSRQEERLFAFSVLGLASSPTDSSKALAMAQLIKISQDVAKKATWQELEKSVFVKIIQEIAKALGIRLTKAKLAQTIPAVGAAVGGGFNTYFTMKVCDAAFYLYRERFLAHKYGADVIEVTVNPPRTMTHTTQKPHKQCETRPLNSCGLRSTGLGFAKIPSLYFLPALNRKLSVTRQRGACLFNLPSPVQVRRDRCVLDFPFSQ